LAAPRFSVEQLRTFLAVAEAQHLSRAAATLHLTQGAVSQQIRQFERGLGLVLFDRTNRGTRLTEAGERLLASCRGAQRAIDHIEEAARNLRSLDVGSLRIGATPTAAGHHLPGLLAAYLARHPRVFVEVATINAVAVEQQVRGGTLDCGMVEGPVAGPGLDQLVVEENEWLLVVSARHPLASVQLNPRVLARHRYVGREHGAIAEQVGAEMLGAVYEVAPRIELWHLDAVRGAVVAGIGYAALPRVAIARELEEGVLVALDVEPRTLPVLCVKRESFSAPALDAFWRLIAATARRKEDHVASAGVAGAPRR
jgi:DNA-binding transcriptional LysR family regulator